MTQIVVNLGDTEARELLERASKLGESEADLALRLVRNGLAALRPLPKYRGPVVTPPGFDWSSNESLYGLMDDE